MDVDLGEEVTLTIGTGDVLDEIETYIEMDPGSADTGTLTGTERGVAVAKLTGTERGVGVAKLTAMERGVDVAKLTAMEHGVDVAKLAGMERGGGVTDSLDRRGRPKSGRLGQLFIAWCGLSNRIKNLLQPHLQ